MDVMVVIEMMSALEAGVLYLCVLATIAIYLKVKQMFVEGKL